MQKGYGLLSVIWKYGLYSRLCIVFNSYHLLIVSEYSFYLINLGLDILFIFKKNNGEQ